MTEFPISLCFCVTGYLEVILSCRDQSEARFEGTGRGNALRRFCAKPAPFQRHADFLIRIRPRPHYLLFIANCASSPAVATYRCRRCNGVK